MTRDLKIRIIGVIITLVSVSIMGYVVFTMKKSIAFSAVAGLLLGMGLVLVRKGEAIVERFKQANSSKKTT
ncbi:MAG TPA: hypothetical protein VKA08_12965 [Balneolales bacterium]|nr:hypothetical protein [Balneolales bacterium]